MSVNDSFSSHGSGSSGVIKHSTDVFYFVFYTGVVGKRWGIGNWMVLEVLTMILVAPLDIFAC